MTTPFKLPLRYEICKLGPQHLDWTKAIMLHSNLFSSPIFSVVYSADRAQRIYSIFKHFDYHVLHGIRSGHSYGVFDTEYEFKRPESASTGGKLYWDLDDNNPKATAGNELLEQMDFPLVSVGLAYDGFYPLDPAQLMPYLAHIALLGTVFHTLDVTDPRDPESEARKPRGPGELIKRSGTATKVGCEGLGLAKGLAHFMMHEKARQGFKTIQCDSAARAVDHIWRNPPAPFTAVVTNFFETREFEMEGENGKVVKPFLPADVWCGRMVVSLR